MVRQDDVKDRIASDLASGNLSAVMWVPTPHVSLDIPLNKNMPNVTISSADLARMREQIRVFKPINVVFDQINIIYESTFDVSVNIAPLISSGESGQVIVLSADTGESEDVVSSDCYDDGDCAF